MNGFSFVVFKMTIKPHKYAIRITLKLIKLTIDTNVRIIFVEANTINWWSLRNEV